VAFSPRGKRRATTVVRATRTTVRPHGKATTIVFRLARSSVVDFTVVRVFPTCERLGVFHVRAHGGVNRVPFRGRLHGRPLSKGTYRLLVRARGTRADAAAVKIVVVDGRPLSRDRLRAARDANVCGSAITGADHATAALAAALLPPSLRPKPAGDLKTSPSSGDRVEGPIVDAAKNAGRSGKSLGERFRKNVGSTWVLAPLVALALGVAALLLILALVPPGAFLLVRAEGLAYRRFELAVAGTGALAAALLLVLVS